MTRFKNYSNFITNCKWFLIFVIIFTFIEALGPIIYNIEQGVTIKHIFSVLCFSALNASIIVSVIGLLGKRSSPIFAVLYVLYALFSYANLLYYRAFEIYMPINMIFEFQQLDGLGGSIISLIRWYDIIYICLCIFICVISHHCKQNKFNYKHNIIIGILCIITTFTPVLCITKLILKWNENSLDWICDNRPITCYKSFGLAPILIHQLQNTARTHTLTNDEKSEIHYIFQQNRQLVCSNTNNISHKRNIVIMLMESLNTACISPEFMPNLHALSQADSTLCCTNVIQLSQAAASIGGQLVTLTGLSGLRQSVFVTDYPINQYPSIVTELSKNDNYYSYTVISTHRHYWRQNIVCKSVGMSELFEQNKNTNSSTNSFWGWDDDKIVLKKALDNLPTDNRPFCTLIIPGNMHAPYDVDTAIDCDAKFTDINDVYLHEYMRRARYLDDQIAAFVSELKARGLYEDTLIVVTSDHQVPSAYCSDAMRKYLSPYIPAIFINTGADWTEQNKRNKDVVFCHSQVYPTMLQLMGLRPEKYAGLFPPMTNIEATKEYDFDNCDYATTTDERLKRIYDLEELIIRSSYFGTMK